MILSEPEKQELVKGAWTSIQHGLGLSHPPKRESPELDRPGASFVTLFHKDKLRGCIGSLDPDRALFVDVTKNAAAAAFRDPRFDPVTPADLEDLALSVSVLFGFQQVTFASDDDLIAQLIPGETGLILRQGAHRATFLPSVWENLPDPSLFVQSLKTKAGFAPGEISGLQALSYRTISFS